MLKKKKVVVLALDGTGWPIINKLIEMGEMPNLKKIIAQGAKRKLHCVVPPSSGPIWTSFSTGKNPNNHGCYDFLLPGKNLKTFHPISSRYIQGKTFYEILEQKGFNSIIVNLPNSYPPKLNLDKSIQITCIMTQGDNFVFPESAKQRIPILKEYRLLPDPTFNLKGDKKREIESTIEVADSRFKCAKELFKQKWDFFFFMFSETDWLQHSFYDKLLLGQEETAIRLFRNIDNYIAWFVKNLPKDCSFIIMSDHGFKTYKGTFFINKWLEKHGFLQTKNIPLQELSPTKTQQVRIEKEKKMKKSLSLGHLTRKILYSKPIHWIARFIYKKIAFRFITFRYKVSPDLDKTRVISPNETDPMFIYINDYRFEGGIVKTREEKQALITQVIDKLKRIRDENGNSIFKDVKRVEEVYHGKIPEKAPDIIIEMGDYMIQQDYFSPKILNHDIQNAHYPESVLIAYGKKIKKTAVLDANLVDMAPTILNLFRIKAPNDMEGKTLKI